MFCPRCGGLFLRRFVNDELILLVGRNVIGDVRAEGSVTASNRQAQQILSVDMERHVSVLIASTLRKTEQKTNSDTLHQSMSIILLSRALTWCTESVE